MTAKAVIVEYVVGKLDGTLHRLENGHRTGVLWGPSVEGNWYASRARINQGETLKFAEWSHAHSFLTAEIGDPGSAFVEHMIYSYDSGQTWHHNRSQAHIKSGAPIEAVTADPCRCATGED